MTFFEASLYFFIFLFGAIVGSFLNVVIARMNTSLTLLGRSFCFSCKRALAWRELFPIASFFALGGKCRYCKSKISWQYPAVEILTGLVFTLVFWKVHYLFELLYIWIVMSVLIVILVYDLKHKIIPDNFAYGFAGLAFVKLLFDHAPLTDFLAGPLLAFPLAALWFVSGGKWIGLGDAKLMLGLGWFLGLMQGIDAMLIAFWTGAVVGIFLIILSRVGGKYGWNLKSEVPFAPSLILGFFLSFLGISPLGLLAM